jgi:hypothetical protein
MRRRIVIAVGASITLSLSGWAAIHELTADNSPPPGPHVAKTTYYVEPGGPACGRPPYKECDPWSGLPVSGSKTVTLSE